MSVESYFIPKYQTQLAKYFSQDNVSCVQI